MTEKRFTYLDASKTKYIGSFFCNSVPLTNEEVVDLLNENEQLKQEIKKWKDKYYDSEKTVIYEYSSDIASDLEELDKEVVTDD